MAGPELPVVAWHKENTPARRRSRDGSRGTQSSTLGNPGRPRRGAVGERKRCIHIGPRLFRHVGGHSRQRPSTDRTGEILEELATKHPDRLRISNVESLPEGWLGKTHALYTGAARATGEWLLFTDADVIFSADCSEKAVRYATTNGLDHLTLPPKIVCRSVLLR